MQFTIFSKKISDSNVREKFSVKTILKSKSVSGSKLQKLKK